ncbi:MAG TPA: HAMP domain-containing sensor histidine kinase [Polyangia bacterium]|jgi:signal transduction histidine kinase|nr:HAMP domain-containing sensor histidine kinase [Polyangia bacterium]
MTPHKGAALNVDAPVTLDELLDRNARETLAAGAADLGVELTVVDRDGRPLFGNLPPPPTLAVQADYDHVPVDVDGVAYVVAPLMHEGDAIGLLVVHAIAAIAPGQTLDLLTAHLHRVADAFVVDGIKRAMSARMHMATVEEANRELTEKNRRLAQAVERLQEADRVKSNFLATVSHELRTPLTSVIGYSEMLLEGIAGPLNDEQREYVRTVMEKGDQLLQLITGILDISRMEAGEMKIDRLPFELDEIVSTALSTIAPHARRKKLSLHCTLPDGLPLVLGDRDKIRQVLLNLLGNAIKFTPEGGRVEVAALEAPLTPPGLGGDGAHGVRVYVKDSGIGVPAEHLKRVFDPFFQVDNSSTREYGGTGLGLSIVKRLVEAHGGAVWVDSDAVKGGATFSFTIPLAPAAKS